MVVLNIDDGALELPGGNLTVEQNIGLTVGSVLKLRQEEEGRDEADDGSTSPDVTTLASKIPSSRVEKLRSKVDHGDFSNVVGGTTDTSAEGTETDRGGLSNDGVGDGTEGTGVDEGDQYAENGLGVVCSGGLVDGGNNTEEEEESDVDGSTPEIDGSSAEPCGKRPGDGVGDELEARVDEIELESLAAVDTGLFEEEGGLVGNQVTGKVLRGVYQASDDCSSEIGALDEVHQGRVATKLLLDFDRSLNHSQGLGGIAGLGVTETL